MSATDSEKKVLVGVDELTAVLMSAMIYADGLAGWEAKAEKMIKEFARLANLEGIFATAGYVYTPSPASIFRNGMSTPAPNAVTYVWSSAFPKTTLQGIRNLHGWQIWKGFSENRKS